MCPFLRRAREAASLAAHESLVDGKMISRAMCVVFIHRAYWLDPLFNLSQLQSSGAQRRIPCAFGS